MPIPVAAAAAGAAGSTGIGAELLALLGGEAGIASTVGGMAMGGGGGGFGGGSGITDTIKKLIDPFNELNKVMIALERPLKSMEQFFSHIAEYVGKFNPASVQLFNLAVADMQASIGEILVPILKFGTEIFRKLGDAISSVSAPIIRVIDVITGNWINALEKLYEAGKPIRGFFNSIVDFISVVLKALQPFSSMLISFGSAVFSVLDPIMEFISLIIDLTTALTKVATEKNPIISMITEIFDSISKFFHSIGDNIRYLRRLLGGSPADKSSMGKSAASVQTESVASYLSKAQQNAFSVGGKNDPQQESADYLKDIRRYFLEGQFIKDMTNAVGGAAVGGVKEIGNKIIGFNVGDAVNRLLPRGMTI